MVQVVVEVKIRIIRFRVPGRTDIKIPCRDRF